MLSGDFEKYCILYGNEEIFLEEIRVECVRDKWFPLLCLKRISDGKTRLVSFYDSNDAARFVARNFKGKESVGVVGVSKQDWDKILEKGIEEMILDWPKKIDLGEEELSVEVFEIAEEPIVIAV